MSWFTYQDNTHDLNNSTLDKDNNDSDDFISYHNLFKRGVSVALL